MGRAFGLHCHRLGGPGPAAAHSYVLNIRGESYRLREKRQSGIFSSHHLLGATPTNGNDNYPD